MDVKPSGEFDMLVKGMKAIILDLENSTKRMIVNNQFEMAEKNLETFKAIYELSTMINNLDAGAYSTLSALFQEKRMNLTQQIPEKLKCENYSLIVDILTSLKNTNTETARMEFNGSCAIVQEYFYDLGKSIPNRQKTAEDIENLFSLFVRCQKAMILQAVNPEFAVAKLLDLIKSVLKSYFDTKYKLLQQHLQNYKFSAAFAILQELHAYPADFPEVHDMQKVKAAMEKMNARLNNLKKDLEQLENCGEFEKIDPIISGLEQFCNDEFYEGEDVQALVDQLKLHLVGRVKAKEDNIKMFMGMQQIAEAQEELSQLAFLTDLKYLTKYKPKLSKLSEDIESLRRQLFELENLEIDPARLSGQLEISRKQSHATYSKQISTLESKITTMLHEVAASTTVECLSVSSSNSLQPVKHTVESLEQIIVAFEKPHPEYTTKLKNKFAKLQHVLNSNCEHLKEQVSKARRLKQWPEVERQLTVLKTITTIKGNYLQTATKEDIHKQDQAVHSVIHAVRSNIDSITKLSFLTPISFTELKDTLTRTKTMCLL